MLLVFCRWGSNIYFHIISDYLLVHIFLTRSEPPYKIRIRNHFLRVLSLNNKTKNHQIEPLQNGELHHSSSKVHQFQIVAFEPSSIMISYSSLGYLTGAFEPFQMAGGLGFGGELGDKVCNYRIRGPTLSGQFLGGYIHYIHILYIYIYNIYISFHIISYHIIADIESTEAICILSSGSRSRCLSWLNPSDQGITNCNAHRVGAKDMSRQHWSWCIHQIHICIHIYPHYIDFCKKKWVFCWQNLVPSFRKHFWTAVFFASGYFQYLGAVAWAKTRHSSATGAIGFSSWGRAFAFSQSTKMLLEMHFSGWILFVVWFHRHWNADKFFALDWTWVSRRCVIYMHRC